MQIETQKEKKPRYVLADVIKGAQKRWRAQLDGSPISLIHTLIEQASKSRSKPLDPTTFNDKGSKTLSEQVEDMLQFLRYQLGDKDYIPTKAEQDYIRDKSDAIALVVSFNKALTAGASTQELERIGRQQAAMRKMTVNGADVARCYLRLLSDLKMTVLNGGNRNTSDAIFTLKPGLPPFTTPVMLNLIGRAYTYFRPLAAEEKVSAAA